MSVRTKKVINKTFADSGAVDLFFSERNSFGKTYQFIYQVETEPENVYYIDETVDNPILLTGGGTWGSITGTLSNQTDLQTALDGKVDENATIVGATKTKITYDAKGLVTSGADATTADIADSLNKRYVTDADLVILGNTSGTNSGNETSTSIGALINAAASATPNDTDLVATAENAGLLKKITWTNVKAFFKTYFDTLYPSGSGTSTGTNTGDNATNSQYSGLAASKQDTLVSGTNIKTINSNSLLGSGDLVITAGDGNDDFTLVASFKSLYNY